MKKIVFFLIFAFVGYAINAQEFRPQKMASSQRVDRAVIFAHGFETGSGSNFDPGWTTITPSGTPWYRDEVNGVPPLEGTMLARVAGGSTSFDAWLITPGIALTQGSTYSINFWMFCPMGQRLEMKIGTSASIAGMTELLFDNNGAQSIPWTLVSVDYTPNSTEDYYIGWHACSPNPNMIVIDDITVVEEQSGLPNNLQNITNYPYSQVPVSQILPSGKVKNAGTSTQTNITLSVNLNGTVAGTSSPLSALNPGETAEVALNSNVNVPEGQNTMIYTFTQNEPDDSPEDNVRTFTYKGTQNLYAIDDVTSCTNGTGSYSAISFGHIYHISQAVTLSQVMVGFGSSGELNYSISLYAMTGELITAATPLFTQTATRNAAGFTFVTVPATPLATGNYFLCVNQLGYDNISVSFDANAAKTTYSRASDGSLTAMSAATGAVAIRMVMQVASCTAQQPTNLAVVPTFAAATFSWEGATPLYYLLTLNDGVNDRKYFTTQNTLAVSGLNLGAAYTWKVAAMCDATNGAEAIGTPFSTLNCGTISAFPFTEGFEGETFPPACWSVYNLAGGATTWAHSGAYHSGNGSAVHYFDNGMQEGWLVTPQIEITNPGNILLEFWSANSWADYSYYNGIWVSTTGSDPATSTFTEIKQLEGSEISEEWKKITVPLSNEYAGQNVYIAFKYAGDYADSWFIDDIEIWDFSNYVEGELAEIITPNSGENLGANETVKVLIKNNGSDPLSNFDLKLELNGTVMATETYTASIASMAQAEYTFNAKLNLSAIASYNIKVTLEVDEDRIPDNNSKIKNIARFPADAVKLFGYRVYDAEETSSEGFVSFHSNNPENITRENDYVPAEATASLYAGTEANGFFYTYSVTVYGPNINPKSFIKISTHTWTDVFVKPISTVPRDMTYDATTNVMYGITATSSDDPSTLVTINMETGAMTSIGTLGRHALTLGCSPAGVLFVVDAAGNLCTVNKTSGAVTVIGATGIEPYYVQSMAFDQQTGRLFWAMSNDNDEGRLIELAPTNGAAFDRGSIGSEAELIGLFSESVPVSNECTVSSFPWTEDFESIVFPPECWTSYNLAGSENQWTRNEYNAHRGAACAAHYYASGEHNNWLVTPPIAIPATGNYELLFWTSHQYPTYNVYSGVWLSTTGSDPASTNFIELKQLEIYTSEVSEPWTKIVIPLNDYAGQTVYIAFKYAGDYADTWYIDDVKVWDPSNDCPVNTFPWIEDFSGGIPDCWENIDDDGDGYGWYDKTVDGVNYAASDSYYDPYGYGYGTVLTPDNWLITSKLILDDSYTLSFKVGASSATKFEENYSVLISTTGTDFNDFTSIYTETLTSADIKTVTLSLNAYSGQSVYLAFRHYNVTDKSTLLIGTVKIFNPDTYIDAELVQITSPEAGRHVNLSNNEPVTVVIRNNGLYDISGFTLELNVNGSIATETYGGTIAPEAQVTHTLTNVADLSAEDDYAITVTVILANDVVPANNAKTIVVTNVICGTVTTFPFVEGFETDAPELPLCWSQEFVTGTASWSVVTSSYGPPYNVPEGSFKAWFGYDYTIPQGQITKLVSPPLDISGMSVPTLQFLHTQSNYYGINDEMKIYYKTSAAASWILLESFDNPIDDWTEEVIALPNKSNSYYIAFEGMEQTNYGVQLDNISVVDIGGNVDVELVEITTPAAGININLSNAEPVSVVIKNNGGNSLTGFDLHLMHNGTPVGTETYTGTIAALAQASYTFTQTLDLSAPGNHTITVTAVATGDQNPDNDSKTITVINLICETMATFPFDEGFENSGANLPGCWTQEYIDGNISWSVATEQDWIGQPNAPHSGTYKAVFENSSYTPHITKLVSPSFDLSGLTEPVLKFWHTQLIWMPSQDELRVFYKTSATGNWVLLAEFVNNIEEWTMETISLPNKSNDYYIAFEGKALWGHGVQLDDITIADLAAIIDGEITDILTPNSGIGLTAAEEVNVLLKNNGGNALSNFELVLELNGTVAATETFTDAIPSMEQTTYTFNQTLNLSAPGGYVITVTMNVPGDQDPSNNSITKTVGNFVSGEVNLIGYRIEDDSYTSHAERGFVAFSSANPENATQIKDYLPQHNATLIQAGEYVNGDWYYYSLDEETYFPWTVPVAFVKLSTETWEETATVLFDTDVDVPRDMTYDYSTEVMYGIFIDDLVTINLTTGELTTVGNFGLEYGPRMAAIACNLTGELYAVDTYANFYAVNKATGAATFIAATGMNPDYLQTMTFDHQTGRLFWAMRGYDSYGYLPRVGKLIEIEPASGFAIDLGVLGGNAQLVGLYSAPTQGVTHTITAIAHEGGTIDPEGTYTVTDGANETFTVIPNTDFIIDRVEVNGAVVVLEGNTYTLENITADATIEAYFKPDQGIDENEFNISVFSYNKVVTIINKNLVSIQQVEIIDMFGRIVWKGEAHGEKTVIALDNMAAGIYAVRIITENQQQWITKVSVK